MSTPEQRIILMKLVCKEFECTEEGIRGANSYHHIADARKVYSYLVRKYLDDTMHRIAVDLNRDHSTIVVALKKMDDLLSYKNVTAQRFKRIEKEFLKLKHQLIA